MKSFIGSFFVAILFLAFICGFHYLLYFFAEQEGSFAVSEVSIKGNNLTERTEILRAAGNIRGANILKIDLFDTAVKVSALEMVEYAVVKKIPPSTIEITVNERAPVAIISDNSRRLIADKDGYRIDIGFVANIPAVTFDFPISVTGNRISEEVALTVLKNLSEFERSYEIDRITIKKEEGTYITFKHTGETIYFLNNKLPSNKYLNYAVSIADTLAEKNMTRRFVTVDEDGGVSPE